MTKTDKTNELLERIVKELEEVVVELEVLQEMSFKNITTPSQLEAVRKIKYKKNNKNN